MKTLLIKAAGITNPNWRGYNSGVGRSTQLLLEALAKEVPLPFELHYYTNGMSSLNHKNAFPFKYHRFLLPEEWGCHKTKIEPFYRAHCLKYDLLHIPHNLDAIFSGEKYVVTLHDVIGYDNAKKDGNQVAAQKWIDMARNSVGIITCSNFSKGEIVDKLGVCADKVDVAYWGINYDKFHIENETMVKNRLNKLGIDFPFFVAISCAHPRKNIRTLLKAYQLFSKQKPQHRLVLVWGNPPSDLLETYAKEIREKNIIFLDYVSDEDLTALYNGASCTMFPTRSEGFGFPVLESFACGTPIMTCKNTSLPEVGRDVALFVGEDDIDGMVDIMKLFESNSYDTNRFLIKSKNLLQNFSWSKTAKSYIDFYQKHL